MAHIFIKTYEAVRDTFRFYRAVYELEKLSDADLRELGLKRSEITSVAADATLKG